jgi:hypothetical protein
MRASTRASVFAQMAFLVANTRRGFATPSDG